jgi:hypothetical protein
VEHARDEKDGSMVLEAVLRHHPPLPPSLQSARRSRGVVVCMWGGGGVGWSMRDAEMRWFNVKTYPGTST